MWKVNFPNTVKYNTVSASLHLSEKVKWAGGIFFLFLSPIQQNTFLGQQCHERHRIILVIWQLYFKFSLKHWQNWVWTVFASVKPKDVIVWGYCGKHLGGFWWMYWKGIYVFLAFIPTIFCFKICSRSSCLRWSSVDSQSICGNLLCTLHIAPLAKGIMFLFRN